MINAQTFSATPTPADAVTPMEFTMARMIRKEMLTRRSCNAIGAPSPTIFRRVRPWTPISVLCISKGSSFLRITPKETITLITCANTVAKAAPDVPILNPAQRIRSPAILNTHATATVNNGVLESPIPLKIQPIRLYATITSIPPPQIRT